MKPTAPEGQSNHLVVFWQLLLLLMMLALGITALLYFWAGLLQPGRFGALGLPLVAAIAGLAAAFNPCALPALPAFLTLVGRPKTDARSKVRVSLGAGLGAMAVVMSIGLVVAMLGEGSKDLVRERFRWIQLSVGLIMVILAGAHLLDRTAGLPVVSELAAHGSRIWERVLAAGGSGGGFTFGGGFVLVGVG